jgi:hypothetical protein
MGMALRSATAVAAVAGLALVHHLGRTYGATRVERRAPMPGDELVACPQTVATHAATLPAPPEQVWPWLVQVGWHRGGWYTPRWVDVLLFPDNWPSADRLLPEHAALSVGEVVPDGPPESRCFFVVREVAAGRRLVLDSTTHLPPRWRERGRARLHWTWSFVLEPVDGGRRTRLVFRWRARTAPLWLTVGAHALIVPADLVMSRGMLRGLRTRVGPSASASLRRRT